MVCVKICLSLGFSIFFDYCVVDIIHIGFIVDGDKVDGVTGHLDMSDDPGTAGLALLTDDGGDIR